MSTIYGYLLTIALSNNVEVQVGIIGIEGVELLQHGPNFSSYDMLIADIAKRIGDIRKPGTGRLIDEEKVGKGVPA